MNTVTKHISPWFWVPSLYLVEGVPYFLVNSISVTLFTQLGMPVSEMALFTTLITLPWIVKPLWSPVVDTVRTKRWWVLMMQSLMILTTLLIAFTAPMGYFTWALIFFTITAFLSATHDIAADGYYMLALNEKQQAGFVGVRSTFYKLANIAMQAGLLKAVAWAQGRSDIAHGWLIVLVSLSGILALLTAWHAFTMPRIDEPLTTDSQPLADVWRSFFLKPGIGLALAFMLIYRLPEALLLKLYIPFFMAEQSAGGLGLSLSTIGDLNAINLVMTIAGGLLGGVIAARWGLKRTMLFFALALTLPCAVYIYLSMVQPDNFWIIAGCIGFEQLGYGLGYTACMLYMIHFAEGVYKTSHFSICTAVMFLGLFLPGLIAGYLENWTGYIGFFILVMILCIPSIFVAYLVYKKI